MLSSSNVVSICLWLVTDNMKGILLMLCVVCASGLPTHKPTFRRGLNKIVGGSDAQSGEIPYQLSFQDISFGFPFHFCGASIYNENWAITAGHCVEGEDFDNPNYFQVTAGELNFDVDDGNEQSVGLTKIIQHEDYNHFTTSNDIALLQLASPLTFNEYVAPVAMPSQGQSTSGGIDCTVSGWGTLTEGGEVPSVLQKVTVPTMSDKDCRDIYGTHDIEDSMICAGFLDGGKDACQGDSGGPLYCDDQLIGIISWGYGCARPGYPGVYAEVAYFVKWIQSHTE